MREFEYVFPAIRGTQAFRQYYVSQCPLRLIPKIFQFDDPDLPAEVRAQRVLNKSRLPEMAEYLVNNRDGYVFSALTASIDAEVSFEALPGDMAGERIGLLHVPMTARFVINDGQHRRAAIQLALEDDPTLGDETIAVVFFMDRGLERSQQMFADLNRYSVRPSASIGVLYDHRDPMARLTRELVNSSEFLRDVVDLEKSTLSPRSRKLFTLSAIYTSCRALLDDVGEADLLGQVSTVREFWIGIERGFPEWQMVKNRKVTAGEVRQDFIHSHGTVLHALGRLGNSMRIAGTTDWNEVGDRLSQIDWHKSNKENWEGRAMIAGRVSKSANNVILTTNFLKKHFEVPLTAEEKQIENTFIAMRRTS